MAKTLAEFEKEQNQATATASTTETQQTEVTQPATGQEAVKEDVVMIGGKARPLKNYEAELRRKFEEEQEEKSRQNQPAQTQQVQPQTNYLEQAYIMAENEMATTGKAVPIQTIMQIANSLARQNLESAFKVKEQSEKTIRNFKRSLRKEDDFVELEDDFDALVDQLKPEQINAPTLEVLFNAVRGKKVPEIKKKVQAQTTEKVEKDTTILGGQPTQATGSSQVSLTLTAAQQAELDQMNRDNDMGWTPKEYLEKINNKQVRFKAQGAKNIPQLLSDAMIK